MCYRQTLVKDTINPDFQCRSWRLILLTQSPLIFLKYKGGGGGGEVQICQDNGLGSWLSPRLDLPAPPIPVKSTYSHRNRVSGDRILHLSISGMTSVLWRGRLLPVPDNEIDLFNIFRRWLKNFRDLPAPCFEPFFVAAYRTIYNSNRF